MNFVTRLKCSIRRTEYRLFSIGNPLQRQVIFSSFSGKQYSDNPRAISEELHEMDSSCRIVWGLTSFEDRYNLLPPYVHVVKSGSPAWFREFAKSSVIVTNTACVPNIIKRKGQMFIQTWHGDRAFKKILYQAWSNQEPPIPFIDNVITDLCVAGSNSGVQMYRDAFKYSGHIYSNGCPRNDCLVKPNPNKIKRIRDTLGIKDGHKVLIFAPTFRDNDNSLQSITLDIKTVLEHLRSKGDKWTCLIRAHSGSRGIEYQYSDNVIDVSDYPDMADLLLIADFLITDYSSCATDFILCHKPIILFQDDLDDYNSKSRGFANDPKTAGFIIARSNEDIVEIIDHYSDDDYYKMCEKALAYFGTSESGNASHDVANVIIQHLDSYYRNDSRWR